MGEGWSDWYAEVMLAEPTDPINSIHTTGGYATFLVSAGFTATTITEFVDSRGLRSLSLGQTANHIIHLRSDI